MSTLTGGVLALHKPVLTSDPATCDKIADTMAELATDMQAISDLVVDTATANKLVVLNSSAKAPVTVTGRAELTDADVTAVSDYANKMAKRSLMGVDWRK